MCNRFLRKAWVSIALLAGVATTDVAIAQSMASMPDELFGSQGIQFAQDTIVEFEFVESNNAYQSTFGVIDLTTGEKMPLFQEQGSADGTQTIARPSTYQDDTGSASANDFKGTPGQVVQQPKSEFQFAANKSYALYLESSYEGKPAGTVYSTNIKNINGQKQTEFGGQFGQLSEGGVMLRWEDTGSLFVSQEDADYDDFIVRAGGHYDCPYN
jgi:hypothetical protein